MADVKKYASINDLDEAVGCILSAKSIIGPFKGLSEISTQTQNALDSLNDAWNYVENMKEGLGDYTASTKKSTTKSQSFSDMVNKQRGKNIKKYTINEVEDYPEYIRDYETLKKGIFKFLGPYDNNDFLQLIFSAIAVDSIEYRRLWDEYCNRFN